MKVIAVNGSPRKKWNTAAMLEHVLKGAASKGAETKLVHLYDLNYKGCTSCFACKRKGSPTLGKCAMNDDLAPLLDEIRKSEALVVGSPIYFGDVTGEVRSFIERLLFPNPSLYDKNAGESLNRKLRTAWVYTMNIPESMVSEMELDRVFKFNKSVFERLLGPCENLMSYDTLQFDDYSQYTATRFDPAAKRKRHEEEFPKDCLKAFELGARLAL